MIDARYVRLTDHAAKLWPNDADYLGIVDKGNSGLNYTRVNWRDATSVVKTEDVEDSLLESLDLDYENQFFEY